MAFGVIHFFPGGTAEQYEVTRKAVHPSDGSLPPGQIFHAAGSSAGGWTIFVMYDSKQRWEAFRDKELGPKLQSGIEGAFTTPPQETEIDLMFVQP